MRLGVALILSLTLHGFLSQWRWDDETPDPGSAGRTAVAIQYIRYVQKPKQLNAMPAESSKVNEPLVESSALLVAVPEAALAQQDTIFLDQGSDLLDPEPFDVSHETAAFESPITIEIDRSDPEELVTIVDNEAMYAGFDQLPTMELPRYRKAFPPRYPRLAQRRGQQGLVMVKAKVGTDGLVADTHIKSSSGHDSLDNRALQTVARWEFHPYENDGRLTVAWVEVPVEFTLNY